MQADFSFLANLECVNACYAGEPSDVHSLLCALLYAAKQNLLHMTFM